MNEDFIFRLGADVSSFTKSITEVEAELKKAKVAIKDALGDDLVKGNKYIQDLENTLKNLKKIGFDLPPPKNLNDIAPAAQKAQNTLTGLSGVVRDLPFGFVAIQNNLPILADSFGNLTKTSGGFKAGLKDLGAALAGPAGVSFAIGAVISGITVLVQKYGSLSAAITEVLNLSKSQKDLNVALETATAKNIGSAEAEITVLRTLTGVLTNNQLSLDARNGAYDELNKKYPGLLTNLDKEKLKNGELNTELAKRLELITTQIKLNGQRAALEKLIAEEAEKSFKTIAQFKNQTFLDALTSEFTGVLKGFTAGTARIQDFSQSVSNAAKTTAFYNTRLDEIQKALSEVDGQILAIVEAGKKKQKQDEEDARLVAEGIRQSKAKAEALKKEREAILKRIEAEQAERKIRVTAQVEFDLQGRGQIDTSEILKKRIKDSQKEVSKTAGAIQIPVEFPRVDPNAIFKTTYDINTAFGALKKSLTNQANFQAATQLFADTFFNPIQDLFSDLLSGSKEAMQQFSKTIANTIKQLVAKVIATGIIQLLITLASGGFGAAAGGFAGGIKTVLKGIGKSLGFAGIANPNFGGISAGGMQMSGAVNVVLRGQDLVGALNRTNAQINRVG